MSNENVAVGKQVSCVTIAAPHSDGQAIVIPEDTRFKSKMWCISPLKEYVLILQEDGNLVLYRVVGTPPSKEGDTFTGERPVEWATMTNGNPNDNFRVQGDGNLVVYGSPVSGQKSPVLWESKTGIPGNPKHPRLLCLQDDGNLVLYKPESFWSTGT